jgi:NAD(P)H dehydrogenase (quinone)
MSVVVTGATGQLGRLVVEALLDRGVPAAGIVAAGRNVEKLDDLAARGVQVRQIDFTEPATLAEAFAGAEKVLLVSSSEVGQRAAQHRNAIAAAREAGVGLLAYTSIAKADTTSMLLAAEHRETEEAVRESGIPFVFLRNGWYLENYTAQLPVTLEHGAVLGSGGDGKVSAATRADFAAAAAEVLVGDGHAGQVYELGGDEAFTLPELAAEVTRQSGTEVVYRDLPVDEYKQVLVGVGLPEPAAAVLADSDLGIARGELFVDSGDLSRLIGRPTTPLASAVASALGR